MPGRGEKSEIIRGMKGTYEFRKNAREKQMPISQMLQKFPHLASYDGEIVSLICLFFFLTYFVCIIYSYEYQPVSHAFLPASN